MAFRIKGQEFIFVKKLLTFQLAQLAFGDQQLFALRVFGRLQDRDQFILRQVGQLDAGEDSFGEEI